MAQMVDQQYFWLDGSRLSDFGRIPAEPTDQKAGVVYTPAESMRELEWPGKRSGQIPIDFLDYDAPTMQMLGLFDGVTEAAFLLTLNAAAGQPAIIYRVRPQSNAPREEGGVLAVRAMTLNIVGIAGGCYGKNLYPYTTDITAPANGSTITIGALTANQSLLCMQHVESVSGTGNFDAKVVADPAGTPVDAVTFTQVPHTGVPDGQTGLYNGAQAATDYRYEITAVSGGTWNVQVAVVIVEEL